jgi:drug/metabolite transporter (DMT)-like permease
MFAGLASGERPAAVTLVGVAVALVAVVVVSRTGNDPGGGSASGLGMAIGAGCGFGLFFTLLFPVRHDGLWPLVIVRLTALAIVLVAAVGTRQLALPPLPVWRWAVPAGLFEASAHLCYLTAARSGLLAVVAVLTSLYPVSTVVLARLVLRERFGIAQLVGLGLAIVGVTLIGIAG